MMRIWRSARHFVIRHSSAGWNPLKNKKILLVYGLLGLPLLAIGGSSYALFLAGGTGPAASAGSINLQQGLVGWWKLDGNTNDSSPYRNATNTVGSPTPTADREGKANGAYSFNGTSDYLSVPSFANSSIIANGQEGASWTLSIWADATGINGSTVFGKNGYNAGIIFGGSGSTGYYHFYLWDTTGAATNITSPLVSLGSWHLITAVYNSGQMTLYMDGVSVGTKTFSGSLRTSYNTTPLGIGSGGTSVYYYNGVLDDARVYNRALSPAEVTALYNQYDPSLNADAGQSGLIGEWKLNGNANDSSPNHNNGTITGTVTATTDREGKANGAMSFNGSASYITVPDSNILSPSAITATAWVYPVSNAGSGNIVSKGGNLEYRYRINSTGTVTAFDRGGTNNITTTQTVPLNQWSMVSFTGDSTGLKIYINGQLSTSGGAAYAPPNSASPLWIGAYQSNGEYFDGSIEDLRIYDRALSASEISNLYNSYNSQVSVSNLQSGLVGDWAFNGNAKDSTPYRNNGTVNGATLTTDREGRANSAYSIVDSNGWINVGSPPTFSHLATTGFTYSIWLMRTGASTYHWPEIMGSSNTHVYYGIRSGNYGDAIYFEYGNPPYDGSTFSGTGAMSLPINSWHQATVTYDGNNVDFYWDGTLKQTITGASLDPTFGGLSFGTSSNGWNGNIGEARVYNRALSATEVQALYNEYN